MNKNGDSKSGSKLTVQGKYIIIQNTAALGQIKNSTDKRYLHEETCKDKMLSSNLSEDHQHVPAYPQI